jgi:alcohol dehydrogenase
MQLGASLAGSAIENSMLGAAHALANPLTANFGVPHGAAIAVVLPHVVRFNGRQCESWYVELLEQTEGLPNCPRGASAELAEFLRAVATFAQLPAKLEAWGVERTALPHLADAAACQWTAKFNPISVGREELLGLYEQAY